MRGFGEVGQGECRSCAAAILWATTTRGKGNPLDVDLTEDGNVAIATVRQEGGDGKLHFAITLSEGALTEAREAGVKLRKSHFATCPNRDRHRRSS